MKTRNMTTIYIKTYEKILLLYRTNSKVGEDSWRGYGGHFENEELNNPMKCVLRELEEESGLKNSDIENLELKYITLRLKNNEIRQNYYYFAELKNIDFEIKKTKEGYYKWFEFKDIFSLEMPFTAKYILKHYKSKGKNDKYIYGGIASDGDIEFVKINEF